MPFRSCCYWSIINEILLSWLHTWAVLSLLCQCLTAISNNVSSQPRIMSPLMKFRGMFHPKQQSPCPHLSSGQKVRFATMGIWICVNTHTHTVASWKGHCGGNGGVWNFMCAIHVDFGLHGRQVQLSTRDFTYAGTRSSCNNNVVVSPRNLSLEDLRIQSSSPFRLPKHCMLKGWKSLGCFDPEVLCAGFYFSCNLGLHQHLLCAKGAHAIRYDQMLGSNEDEIKPEPTSRNEIQGKPWSMPPRGWQYQNLGWLLQLCGQIQIVMYDLASPPLTNGNIACGVATQCEPSPLFIRASNDVIQGRVNHEWYQLPLINSIRWWSPSK